MVTVESRIQSIPLKTLAGDSNREQGVMMIKSNKSITSVCPQDSTGGKSHGSLGMKCTRSVTTPKAVARTKRSTAGYQQRTAVYGRRMCLACPRPEPVERGDDEGTSHLALEVSSDDFDKATDELKKAGVKVIIDKPIVRPTGKGLYFFDTEQNYIQLWSRS